MQNSEDGRRGYFFYLGYPLKVEKGSEAMTDLEQAIADMVRKALEELMAPDRLYSAESLPRGITAPLPRFRRGSGQGSLGRP